MLEDATRIQLDLTETLAIDQITLAKTPLKYTRDTTALFIDFPETLHKGQVYEIAVAYHGAPIAKGRFGGMTFETDPAGRPWITTACEDDGSSIWWPSKDQWKDEPQDGMDLSIAVPNALTDVSNGRFVSKIALTGDQAGYTQWNWHVSYPINSYDVSLNIGAYAHFSDTYKSKQFPPLTLDYYALPEDLDKAKAQFPNPATCSTPSSTTSASTPSPATALSSSRSPIPAWSTSPPSPTATTSPTATSTVTGPASASPPASTSSSSMRPATSGLATPSPPRNRSSMWIHEGWDTYLETLFVEFRYGRPDAINYTNGLIPKVRNRTPIISEPWANQEPPQDMYFKAALMIATLRSWINNDPRWFTLIHDFYQHFKYQNILTADVVAWWNDHTGLNLTPFFNQYLRRTEIPCLELNFDEAHPHRPLQVAGQRTRLRHADPGRRPRPLADHPPHHHLAVPPHPSHQGPIPGRHRPLLRHRLQNLTPPHAVN